MPRPELQLQRTQQREGRNNAIRETHGLGVNNRQPFTTRRGCARKGVFTELRAQAEEAAVQLGFERRPTVTADVKAELKWWDTHGYGLPYNPLVNKPRTKTDYRVRVLNAI
jgi:hypothetical protein